jgi:hypothetical protein
MKMRRLGIDAGEVATLLSWRLTFNGYYKISTIKKVHSKTDTNNTKDARKTYQKLLRQMGIGRMKRNIFMTDRDRMACGLNNNANTYTLSPVAKTSPLIDFRGRSGLGGTVISLDPDSHKACKPLGQNGIRVTFGFYKPNQAKPLELDCTFTVFLSKCFGKIVFPTQSLGLLFVGYARYYNTRNILGLVATDFSGMVR